MIGNYMMYEGTVAKAMVPSLFYKRAQEYKVILGRRKMGFQVYKVILEESKTAFQVYRVILEK